MENHWSKNISYLPKELITKLFVEQSKPQVDSVPGKDSIQIELSKTNLPILKCNDSYLHSRHDPKREAMRLAEELPYEETDRVYLFLGAGLGYIVKEALDKNPKTTGVWIEDNPYILKKALECLDFSELLEKNRLQILLAPIHEDVLYSAFRGKSTVPVTFVPHRGSFQWNPDVYNRLRLICEGFFHKKDVNLATLVRFEQIWTRNMIQNLAETFNLHPVSRLFGIADGIPILVAGAGPSLSESLEDIKKYRNSFVLIAVDTALQILNRFHIEPDLVYTVDPQSLNSFYLEGYSGNAGLILDPTSTYLTPRLESNEGKWKGFFTTSPFPLTEILQSIANTEIGSIPFGGSVSTNAYSLAKLMGGSPIYLVGQDLGFSKGLAHAKGAILEERLNWKESRRFRRELHNFRQLTALPKHFEEPLGDNGNSKNKIHTNEKLIIFRNWFSENAVDAINLTKSGLRIPNLKESDFESEFSNLGNRYSVQVTECKRQIREWLSRNSQWGEVQDLQKYILQIVEEIHSYLPFVEKGASLSQEIYDLILAGNENPILLQKKIKEMDNIDEHVSGKKNLGKILSTSLQRVIFSVTEGFDSELSVEEKENPRIGIAKKSVLLYKGLLQQATGLRRQLNRSLLRIQYQYPNSQSND